MKRLNLLFLTAVIILLTVQGVQAITANVDSYPVSIRWGDSITLSVIATCNSYWQGGLDFLDEHDVVMHHYDFAVVGGSYMSYCNSSLNLHIEVDDPGYYARFLSWKSMASAGGNWKIRFCATDYYTAEEDCTEVDWFVNNTLLFNSSIDSMLERLYSYQFSGEPDECQGVTQWVSYGQDFSFLVAVNDAKGLLSNIKTVFYDVNNTPVMSKAWFNAESGYQWDKVSTLSFNPWSDAWLNLRPLAFYRAETTAINSEGLVISTNTTFCSMTPFAMSYGPGVTYDCGGGVSVPLTNGQQLLMPSMFAYCSTYGATGPVWWEDDLGNKYDCGIQDIYPWALGYFYCYVPCENYSNSRNYILKANLSFACGGVVPAILSSDLDLSDCGNGVRVSDEECDSDLLGSQTCTSLGFDSGTLACNNGCTFDVTNCLMPEASISVCGNGIIESGESCDGLNLDGQTCVSRGFSSGVLACNACSFNTSGCKRSGGGGGGVFPPVVPPVTPPLVVAPPGPSIKLNFGGFWANISLAFGMLFTNPLKAFAEIGKAASTFPIELIILVVIIGGLIALAVTRGKIKGNRKR